MKASQDELKSLFKQAFEACGYDFGRCEMAAESIVWAEMVGLNVLQYANECLRPLPKNCSALQVLLDEPERLILDNQGMNVLSSAIEIVNLGVANALSGSGACEVMVLNAGHPILITKILSDSRHHGLEVRGYWSELGTQRTLEIKSDLSHDFPELFYYSQDMDVNPEALSITFELDSRTDRRSAPKSNKRIFDKGQVEQHMPAEYFSRRYQQSLNDGIHIEAELWQHLLHLGAQVLVESNELSRQGAGS